MYSRRTLAVIIIATVVVGIGCGSALAQDTINMKLASMWSGPKEIANRGFDYIKARMEQLTDGRVSVSLHKGTLGSDRDIIESVQLGTIDGAFVTTGTLGGFIKLADIFMIPFLFSDEDHLNCSFNGALGKHLEKQALDKKMRIMGWINAGWRGLMGNGKPIFRPQEVKGRKIRVMQSPVLIQTYRNYGAVAVPMPYTEVYTALQQGVIDGFQGGHGAAYTGIHEVCEWYIHHSECCTPLIFIMNPRFFSKLPDDVKQALEQTTMEAIKALDGLHRWGEAVDMPSLWKKAGKAHYLDAREYRAEWKAMAERIYPKFAEMLGPDGEYWINWVNKTAVAFPLDQWSPTKQWASEGVKFMLN
jgi:C4-dicarboxylate-binding protein DctP